MSAFKLLKHFMTFCMILGVIIIINICDILIEHYFGAGNVITQCIAILAATTVVLTIFDEE